jgi:capsular exopolysaccharide synthesis family protein
LATSASNFDFNPGAGSATTIDLSEQEALYEVAGRRGFDFRYVLAAVRSNLWVILAIVAVMVGLAVVTTMLETPRYTAETSVQINDQSDRVISENEDNSAQNGGGWDTERFLTTQLDILRSRGLALRVAQRLKLFNNARFFEAQESELPPAGTSQAVLRDTVIGMLQGHMDVDLPRETRVARISYNSTDPEISAMIANAFAAEFIQANLQRKYDSSAYARTFVADQLAEAKTRLETSERDLNTYARQAGLIRTRDGQDADGKSTGGGESVTTSSLMQLNSAANEARAARIAAEGRWKAVSSVPLLSSKEVLANGTVNSLMAQRAELQSQLKQERAKHLDDYPTVVQLRARVNEINSQLQTVASGVRDSVKNDYQAAVSAEQALAGQVESLKGDTLAEQDRSVQYNLLAREADTNRTIYDGLLQRYKELNAAAGISASNIAIIDVAEPPLGPSSPNLMRNVGIALILGLGIAAVVVFLKDQFDDSVRVPEDVEQKLHLPLLGVVPKAEGEDPEAALADPKSPVSEAYNSLRGSLLYSTTSGLPRVMLVTSAQPSEGKTTTSYAIAMGFARMGKRVVLIDVDLRRPSLHRRIDFDNQTGMSTLLTSTDPVEAVIQPSALPNLALIPSGPIPPSPTELLASNRMQAVLDELAEKFDVVVVDSPPILGLADAPLMSALVDGVIFVVESDRGRRGTMKAAMRRLRAMRPIMLGAVLTKFDATKAGNRYSEYYGYEYYQYRTDAKSS